MAAASKSRRAKSDPLWLQILLIGVSVGFVGVLLVLPLAVVFAEALGGATGVAAGRDRVRLGPQGPRLHARLCDLTILRKPAMALPESNLPSSAAAKAVRDEELTQIRDALRGLRFGAVNVIVQDGVVVQIDRTEKRRIRRAEAK